MWSNHSIFKSVYAQIFVSKTSYTSLKSHNQVFFPRHPRMLQGKILGIRKCFTWHSTMGWLFLLLQFFCVPFYRDASDQKFKRNEGNAVNQLMKAIAIAVSNCGQWFRAQLSRSLSIRTVMPAEAQAAANVRVDVICKVNNIWSRKKIQSKKQTKNSEMSGTMYLTHVKCKTMERCKTRRWRKLQLFELLTNASLQDMEKGSK